MKKKLWILVAIIVMFILTMSGRWSRHEPKDLAIGTAYLYEKTDDGLFSITAEFLHLPTSGGTDSSGGGGAQSLIRNFKGATPSEAVRDISIKMEKPFFGAQNRARLFSEKFLMEEGLVDIMDFFIRDHIADERPYMIVVKGDDPTSVFEADIGASNRLGEYIYDIAGKKQNNNLSTSFVNTLKFAREYYTEGLQPVISVVQVVKNESNYKTPGSQKESAKTELIFEGLGVMKDGKLVGYLDRIEARTYVMLTDKVMAALISIPVEDKYIAMRINKVSPKVKTSFKDDKVKVDIQYKMELMITQNTTKYDISNKEGTKAVEETINKFIEEEMMRNIAKVQKDYKSDIFGFGAYFHRQNHEEWNRIKSQWDDKYFAEAEVNVKVKSEISYTGETREKFGENAE